MSRVPSLIRLGSVLVLSGSMSNCLVFHKSGLLPLHRLAKIARDSRPQGVRSRGRPKKRWKESLIKAPPPALTSGRTGVSL